MSAPLPSLTPVSQLSDFFTGLWLPVRAARLIAGTPTLRRLSAVSAVVTAVALVALLWGSWVLGQRGAEALLGPGDGLRAAAVVTVGFFFFLALYVGGALTVPLLLLAPLQDPISEAVEVKLGGFTAPPFSLRLLWRGVAASVAHTLLRLACMVAGFLVLFPLNFVPGVGSAVWWVLSSLWSSFWIAAEHLSNPMARHLLPFGAVVRALWRRLPLALGFGVATYAVLWVPVVNFFLMPLAVVSGTLLYRALLAVGAVGPGTNGGGRALGLP